MRILILSTIALLIFSCSNKEKTSIASKESLQKTSQTKEKELKIEELNENRHYTGFIHKFYFFNRKDLKSTISSPKL